MSDLDGINRLENVSEFKAERMAITFKPLDDRRVSVQLAGTSTGMHLISQVRDGETVWWVMNRPRLGSFAVRGEAVYAAIRTTFDPDDSDPNEDLCNRCKGSGRDRFYDAPCVQCGGKGTW